MRPISSIVASYSVTRAAALRSLPTPPNASSTRKTTPGESVDSRPTSMTALRPTATSAVAWDEPSTAPARFDRRRTKTRTTRQAPSDRYEARCSPASGESRRTNAGSEPHMTRVRRRTHSATITIAPSATRIVIVSLLIAPRLSRRCTGVFTADVEPGDADRQRNRHDRREHEPDSTDRIHQPFGVDPRRDHGAADQVEHRLALEQDELHRAGSSARRSRRRRRR